MRQQSLNGTGAKGCGSCASLCHGQHGLGNLCAYAPICYAWRVAGYCAVGLFSSAVNDMLAELS
jgi:hypothetical protein